MAQRFKKQPRLINEGRVLQEQLDQTLHVTNTPSTPNYASRDSTYSLDGMIEERKRLLGELERLDKSIAHRRVDLFGG